MRRGARAAVASLGLLLALGSPARAPAAPEAGILPLEAYASPEARALAEAHAAELRALQAHVSRCLRDLDVERHGIAFRKPRGSLAASVALTLWVWLPADEPLEGADLVSRAGHAFRRHGQRLFRTLVARSRVFADPHVSGYGLILTWVGPAPRAGRLVGESLAVFADKLTTANFAHDTIPAGEFLTRADMRAFDGETELHSPRLVVGPDGPARPWPSC